MGRKTTSALFVHPPADRARAAAGPGGPTVQIDVDALREALRPAGKLAVQEPGALLFNLAPDLALPLKTDLIEPFSSTALLWRGSMAGMPAVYGHLAVTGLDGASDVFVAGTICADGRRYVHNRRNRSL